MRPDLRRDFWRQCVADAVTAAAHSGDLGWRAFLLWYGWGALRTALSSNIDLASAAAMKQGRWRIVATMMAVTWLNPHVYLDTFVVLGSLGGQLPAEPRTLVCAGHRQRLNPVVLWPGALAAWLSPVYTTAKAQRIINTLVGVVMWGIALKLALQATGFQ